MAEKEAEKEEEKETPDVKTADVEKPKEQVTPETETPAEGETPEKVEEKKPEEEAMVPSFRLREETDKRKAVEDKLARVEGSLEKPVQMSSEQFEEQFQKRIEDVGYARAFSELTYGIAQKITDERIKKMEVSFGSQAVELNVKALGSEAQEYAPEIRKRMENMSFELKVNPEVAKRTYYQILGEKMSKGELEKDMEQKIKARLTKNKKILGETGLGESKGGETTPSALTKEQEEDRAKRNLSAEKYTEVLKYNQQRDKDAGREPRTTIFGK